MCDTQKPPARTDTSCEQAAGSIPLAGKQRCIGNTRRRALIANKSAFIIKLEMLMLSLQCDVASDLVFGRGLWELLFMSKASANHALGFGRALVAEKALGLHCWGEL
eukprot:3278170-Amphidinium_carterae.1